MRLPRMAFLVSALVAALAVSACTPFWADTQEAEPAPWPTRPDPAEVRLADAAERAEAALTALSRIRSAAITAPAAELPPDVPPALRRPLTLSWIGPLESLAESLASYAGYRFIGAGAAPVRPVMVAIEAADAPLIEVLRDAGLQAGTAATLTVDAARRTVRLDWRAEHSCTAPEDTGS